MQWLFWWLYWQASAWRWSGNEKCVDKLYTLRAKQQGKGKAAQLRAASGRLVTDIEMNSTYRGAVEIFNLCRNLHLAVYHAPLTSARS